MTPGITALLASIRRGERFGWAGPEKAKSAWELLHENFRQFFISGATSDSAGKRCVLWDYTRKVNRGQDLPNVPQEIGDCVSWGMKHSIDYLACMEIIRLGDNEEFHESFAPYFYGISRWQIGGGKLGNGDGSLGSWAAEGVRRYGVLRADETGVPPYSGTIAKEYGRRGPPEKFIAIAKHNLLKTAARVTSWPQMRDGLFNGYPATIASMRGWEMETKQDHGKSWFHGRDMWPHQTCIVGYDETGPRPGALRLNSWGPDAHGPQLDGPNGSGWQDVDDLDKELRNGDTEAYLLSQFDGFPAKPLDYDVG